jgi:site-specific DNA-methyltransferase (adenine-specific)
MLKSPTMECFELKKGRARYRLYREDCIPGIRERVRPGSVDVVVTSPPYNLGVHYNRYDDTIGRDEYLAWTGAWAAEVKNALAEDGSVFLNVGSKPTDPLIPFLVLDAVGRHLVLQNVLHWVKSIAIEKEDVGDYPGITRDVSVGHYKPINSERFVNDCHEYVFHLTRNGRVPLDRLSIGVPYQDKSNVTRWRGGRDKRCRGNTWFIPYPTIQNRNEQRPHPATFPVKLAEMCIRLHGVDKTRLVMDPFLGLGPTALAALKLRKSFVGFEIDPDYLETAGANLAAAAQRK